ncbi:unnamed protein product [Moneuplotes crassus]|uniref:Uncharacterized protein n=1 Tax=Euplotes crassus TaxID=5936 RepID=A0AAD1U610_EUPCR|nr:unnamed protein product [Moneuplotes crassus]
MNLNAPESVRTKHTADILENCDLFKPQPESNVEKILRKANKRSSDALQQDVHEKHWKVQGFYGRLLLRITLKFLKLFYWIMMALERIKESDIGLFKYPPKLPEPMVLTLAKKKLRTLKKLMKYSEEIESIKRENTILGYYRYLLPWLKLNSLLTNLVFDILAGVCFCALILYLTGDRSSNSNSQAESFIQFISNNFLFWVEINKLEKQVKYTMMFFGNFKPFPLLDQILGEVLINLLHLWNFIIHFGSEYNTTFLAFIFAPIGLLGASFQVALAHDLFALLTSHIHTMYSFFAFVYKTTLHVLQNLFYMSRGRKFNILKGKVDEADYRIEELLFGVLMMTVIMFLLPTLLVYYILMVYLMCFVVVFQSSMIITIQIITKFPLFILMWMLRNKRSFPKGLELHESPAKDMSFVIKPLYHSPFSCFSKLASTLIKTVKKLQCPSPGVQGQIPISFLTGDHIYPILKDLPKVQDESSYKTPYSSQKLSACLL